MRRGMPEAAGLCGKLASAHDQVQIGNFFGELTVSLSMVNNTIDIDSKAYMYTILKRHRDFYTSTLYVSTVLIHPGYNAVTIAPPLR